MNINNIKGAEIYKAYNAKVSEQVVSKDESNRKTQNASSTLQDKVNISDKVKSMKDIDQAVSAAPDIRKDKVVELEKKLDSGTYQPDYGVIADKLLNPDISARV